MTVLLVSTMTWVRLSRARRVLSATTHLCDRHLAFSALRARTTRTAILPLSASSAPRARTLPQALLALMAASIALPVNSTTIVPAPQCALSVVLVLFRLQSVRYCVTSVRLDNTRTTQVKRPALHAQMVLTWKEPVRRQGTTVPRVQPAGLRMRPAAATQRTVSNVMLEGLCLRREAITRAVVDCAHLVASRHWQATTTVKIAYCVPLEDM